VVEGTPEHVDEDALLVGHFTVSGLRRLKKGVLVMLAINGSGILEVCPLCVSICSGGRQIWS
jgi:hypothetical protein